MKEQKNGHTVWLTDDAWDAVEVRLCARRTAAFLSRIFRMGCNCSVNLIDSLCLM